MTRTRWSDTFPGSDVESSARGVVHDPSVSDGHQHRNLSYLMDLHVKDVIAEYTEIADLSLFDRPLHMLLVIQLRAIDREGSASDLPVRVFVKESAMPGVINRTGSRVLWYTEVFKDSGGTRRREGTAMDADGAIARLAKLEARPEHVEIDLSRWPPSFPQPWHRCTSGVL